MELLIKIPKEFEQHFKQDAFEDSLHRLSADAHLIAGIYEQETAKMLRDAFKSAVSVPPHGDLIDVEELMEKVAGLVPYYIETGYEKAFTDGLSSVYEIVKASPTIIPASEEGET